MVNQWILGVVIPSLASGAFKVIPANSTVLPTLLLCTYNLFGGMERCSELAEGNVRRVREVYESWETFELQPAIPTTVWVTNQNPIFRQLWENHR
jgi:hypothetical protein